MMNEIGSITPELSVNTEISLKPKTGLGESFKNVLVNNIKDTNKLMVDSDKLTQDFALGKNTDMHKVIIAMERAQIAMQYTMQIRNKLVEGAQELLRMQV